MINIDAAAFEIKINEPGVVLLDVRTPEEFQQAHIAKAINLNIYNEYFISDISALDKAKSYAIYCRSGKRSQDACQIMAELGFTNTYNLTGGIIEWVEAKKEIKKIL